MECILLYSIPSDHAKGRFNKTSIIALQQAGFYLISLVVLSRHTIWHAKHKNTTQVSGVEIHEPFAHGYIQWWTQAGSNR